MKNLCITAKSPAYASQYLLLDSERVHAELCFLDELDPWVLIGTRDSAAVLDLGPKLAAVYDGMVLAAAGLGPGGEN